MLQKKNVKGSLFSKFSLTLALIKYSHQAIFAYASQDLARKKFNSALHLRLNS